MAEQKCSSDMGCCQTLEQTGAGKLKAMNPNDKSEEEVRTPIELLDFIDEKGREVAKALAVLRSLSAPTHLDSKERID